MKLKFSKMHLFSRSPFFFFVVLILAFHLFFRFYALESRAQFTWDQVDNAWNAKNIIVNHEYPLTGMPVKQDSGFFIGPLYYYFVAFFYFLTNLDPVASPIIAGLTSIFTFFTLYYVAYKIFNKWIALIALFIHTFSFYVIELDRIQWPVNFIPGLSLLIFYLLYRIVGGDFKKVLFLAVALGLSFHIHFTSLFYYLIVGLALPIFPRSKRALFLYLMSLPLFFVWFVPTIANLLQSPRSSKTFVDFYLENSHGLHLRRIIQVIEIEFLEVELIFKTHLLPIFKYVLLPVFLVIYYIKNHLKAKNEIKFIYLLFLWFAVPLICLSMFRGDITPYYFSLLKPLSIIMASFIIYELLKKKKVLINLGIGVLALVFVYYNIDAHNNFKIKSLRDYKELTYKNFMLSRGNEFTYGAPESYLYYFYEYRHFGKR